MARKYRLKADLVKFHVSGWKLFSFLATSVFGVHLLLVTEWAFDPKQYVAGWPNHRLTFLEQAYYVFCFGNVAYSSINLLLEPKQKDFPAMIIHHSTTLFLMVFSYLTQFQRIGCIVLIVHDISDPIMELAKCSLYLGKKTLANVSFAVFALMFFFTRLYLFPYYVICTFWWYGFHENGDRFPNGDVQMFHLIMVSLYILQILHIYWAYLIVVLASKVVCEKELKGDIRDKDE